MSFKLNPSNSLNPKLCYDLWVGKLLGKRRYSIYEIPEILESEYNVRNVLSGKKVTPQGVWRAACMYMLENVSQTRTDTVSLYAQTGRIFDEVEFSKEMVRKAQQHLSRKRYFQWIIAHPEMKQYEK